MYYYIVNIHSQHVLVNQIVHGQTITRFTAVTFIPRFTYLTGASVQVTITTVGVRTGNGAVGAVISWLRATLNIDVFTTIKHR